MECVRAFFPGLDHEDLNLNCVSNFMSGVGVIIGVAYVQIRALVTSLIQSTTKYFDRLEGWVLLNWGREPAHGNERRNQINGVAVAALGERGFLKGSIFDIFSLTSFPKYRGSVTLFCKTTIGIF